MQVTSRQTTKQAFGRNGAPSFHERPATEDKESVQRSRAASLLILTANNPGTEGCGWGADSGAGLMLVGSRFNFRQ
tara:strand:- start:9412 stop:9639 length:228 start_codon:yes stop_codon:yes gene_type:complete